MILERRDDENLVLTRSDRFAAGQVGMTVAAHLLRTLARRDLSLVEELVAEELAWLHWLPATERRQCVDDLLGHLAAGAETGTLLPFAQALAQWRSTAEVWSDHDLARRLRGPFPGDGAGIERPDVSSA